MISLIEERALSSSKLVIISFVQSVLPTTILGCRVLPRVHETRSVQLLIFSAWMSVTAKFRDYIIFGAELRREVA